jgi:hypothetical protein
MSRRDCEYVYQLGVEIHAFLTVIEVTAVLRPPPNLTRGIFKLLLPKGDCHVKFGSHLLMMRYFYFFQTIQFEVRHAQ